MKYYILFKDYGNDYCFREYDNEHSAQIAVTDLKSSYEEVIVIKGKQLEIKTNYSLEE